MTQIDINKTFERIKDRFQKINRRNLNKLEEIGLKKLIEELRNKKNYEHFVGFNYRRCGYPENINLCDLNCDAWDITNKSKIETCCHRFIKEKIAFCIDYGIDYYCRNNSRDYILQKKVNKEWMEIEDKLEEVKESRSSWVH